MAGDTDGRAPPRRPALHFIGFRGDEYLSALRVFGPPDFFHIGWDRWARMEIVEGDVAIFARGSAGDEPSIHGFPDLIEA